MHDSDPCERYIKQSMDNVTETTNQNLEPTTESLM